MSKARPHAHIYEKWIRGLRKAVPMAEERCALLEYIIAYQIAKVYETGELPQADGLSQAAALALAMLEGDLEELTEERRLRVKQNQENGAKNKPPQPDPAGPNGYQSDPAIQSNTIQDNNKAIQGNTQALAGLADGLNGQIKEFDLGLALLRAGYIVKAADLHDIYDRAAQAKNPAAYAAKAMNAADPSARAGLSVAANYIEATGCKDTRALEVYGAALASEDGEAILCVRCTTQAREVLSRASKAKVAEYLQTCGAARIVFSCNGQ